MMSSDIRKRLKKVITIDSQEEDIPVESSGEEEIALFTLNKPDRNIPPLPITTTEAINNWTDVLGTIIYKNASYKFKVKNHKTVYLVRHPNLKVPLCDRWSDHARQFRVKRIATADIEGLSIAMSDVKDYLENMTLRLTREQEEAKNISKHIFALINRKGDPLATPESGLVQMKSADNLDIYEVD